ncbi:hypothetical protein V3C99_009734 [Haemonchus contortus]
MASIEIRLTMVGEARREVDRGEGDGRKERRGADRARGMMNVQFRRSSRCVILQQPKYRSASVTSQSIGIDFNHEVLTYRYISFVTRSHFCCINRKCLWR